MSNASPRLRTSLNQEAFGLEVLFFAFALSHVADLDLLSTVLKIEIGSQVAWYEAMRHIPMSNYHDVEFIDIQPKGQGYYLVDIYMVWTNIRDGKSSSTQMQNRMMIRLEGESVKLQGYFPRAI